MPRFSMRQILRDMGVTITSISDKPRVSIIEVNNDIVTLFIIIVITSATLTLFLLFISSLGGEPFDQTWTAIPALVFVLIVCWITSHIQKGKNEEEDNK